MVTSAAEQARRLDAEVGDALFVIVHDAKAVLLKNALIFLFNFLGRERNVRLSKTSILPWQFATEIHSYQFIIFSHGLPGFGLSFEIFAHFSEVTLIQVGDFRLLLRWHFLKRHATLKKVGYALCQIKKITTMVTFRQSLKKFFLNISLVVYSWSNIFAKNVATSSASGLSLICFPGEKQNTKNMFTTPQWLQPNHTKLPKMNFPLQITENKRPPFSDTELENYPSGETSICSISLFETERACVFNRAESCLKHLSLGLYRKKLNNPTSASPIVLMPVQSE